MVDWQGRSLIDLASFTAAEIEAILTQALAMKKFIASGAKKTDLLRGKAIVNVFSENSTRTRSSFELAGKYLGADVININKSTSSMTKGESLRDTLLTVAALAADAIVMRHEASGAAAYAVEIGKRFPHFPVVINAGDGLHAHPSQGLLDLFTVREQKGKIKGLKYVIVGDILHSRVARSDLAGFTKLGAEVHMVGPRTLVPREFAELGAILHTDLKEALRDADAIQILRLQNERAAAGFIPNNREYARTYGVSSALLQEVAPDAMIMHPGPINRGVEISHELAYAQNAFLQTQVKNGVCVRMAILNEVLNGGNGIEALA